jgi:mRNA-degrading endonuclease RelE of RelBE toxin-antitoxin system
MNWELELTKSAQKELHALPQKDRERVRSGLLLMQQDPFGGDVVRLKAQPAAWRRRVGSYRIFFDVRGSERRVIVAGIARRTTTTYR